MGDIEQTAAEARKHFEQTRDGGSTYWRTRDDTPDWVRELVQEAHADMFADDWRYETIVHALDAIADGGGEEGFEFADSNVDVCAGARIDWLASHGVRVAYCDQGTEEATGAGIIERIGWGQWSESLDVYGLVYQALEDAASDRQRAGDGSQAVIRKPLPGRQNS
jgi:hypothetical protein